MQLTPSRGHEIMEDCLQMATSQGNNNRAGLDHPENECAMYMHSLEGVCNGTIVRGTLLELAYYSHY